MNGVNHWHNAGSALTPAGNGAKKDKRYRKQFRFWLDVEKADERQLVDHVQALKTNRNFAAAIRDGLRLVLDLRRGKTEVLRELFPWVLEQQPVVNQSVFREREPSPESVVELEVRQSSGDSENKSTWNFVIASSLQVYGDVDSLPQEIIEYGVRTGRIPPDMVKQHPLAATVGPRAMEVPQFEVPAFDDDDDDLADLVKVE